MAASSCNIDSDVEPPLRRLGPGRGGAGGEPAESRLRAGGEPAESRLYILPEWGLL